ncbi:hypothetical protein RND71_042206 [Anisodus tanguticus]|uniref:Transcription repressor n=1 Tax=Anisodus tanguticus TaxID=243964 RepID=A0AAE1UUK9_9SOLA|nr:hypothetical protein RND71_042206 [Anisodus tanguticus]
MGKKMNFGSWQWPSCAHPKTLSFRANDNNNIFKTIHSIFLDPSTDHHHDGVLEIETTPESWFTNSSESASFSTESDELLPTGEPLEMIIKGVRSERLFFEPNCTSSLILDKTARCTKLPLCAGSEERPDHKGLLYATLPCISALILDEQQKESSENQEPKKLQDDDDGDQELPFKESVALAMESEDPYLDFKKSMEEMVETHEIKDWESLQELLGWYLKMNGKINHGFIIGAFVDLLIEFSPPTSDSITCYFSAPSSPMSSVGNKEQEKGSSTSPLG